MLVVDRGELKALLAQQRAATVRRIEALARDVDGIVDAAAGVAVDDEHDPDGATIAFERAKASALLEHARAQLTDVDRALARLADGSYGTCQECGADIGAPRLQARPTAGTCISCASSR